MGCLVITIVAGVLYYFDILETSVFITAVLGSIAWMYIGSWLYFKFGWFKFFYHDLLGWHTPDEYGCTEWFDGCSEHAVCQYCGKDIMQDSQGNWFSYED